MQDLQRHTCMEQSPSRQQDTPPPPPLIRWSPPIRWLIWRSRVRYSFLEKLASELLPWTLSNTHRRSARWAVKTFVSQISPEHCRVKSKVPNWNQWSLMQTLKNNKPTSEFSGSVTACYLMSSGHKQRHLQFLTHFFFSAGSITS